MRRKLGRPFRALAAIILVTTSFALAARPSEAISGLTIADQKHSVARIVGPCDGNGGPDCGNSAHLPNGANIAAPQVEDPAVVSEPTALGTLGVGLLVFAVALRWRKSARRRGGADALNPRRRKRGWRNALARSFSWAR